MAKKAAPKKAAAKSAKSTAPDLSHIHPDLRHLALPLDSLTLDPQNSLKHSDRDLAATEAMLKEFGQRQPIIGLKGELRILAGNGRLMAARRLGWSHIAVLQVDDARDAQIRYAIGDNQSGRLAEWDQSNLGDLMAELDALGPMEESNLTDTLRALESQFDADPDAEDGDTVIPSQDQGPVTGKPDTQAPLPPEPVYRIVITCEDEMQQQELLNEFDQRKLRVKVSNASV